MCAPLAVAAAGYLGYRSVKWAGNKFGGGGGPAPTPAEPLPTENLDASAQQATEFNRRRTLRALSGSNTNLTKGLATPATGAAKSLLGS